MNPKAAKPVPSANHGDEVYFHKSGVPCSGRVLATGKHGCTVEHEGKHHKLKWEHIAGHKKRAPQRYTVEEEGEDGMIVKDANGKRRLVTIPPEARKEQLKLEKSP
jgi:hypothetical protein